MIQQLQKLIEHKRKYLESCSNERTKVSLNVEINILQNSIEEMAQAQQQIDSLNKTIEAKADETERLIIICNLHGIDLREYTLLSKQVLLFELERDRKESIVRVPHRLKTLIQP